MLSLLQSKMTTFDASRTEVLLSSVLAASLGLFFLYGAGIAPIEILHNAAHDARHVFAFPCH